jgi:hypothetical protein
MPLHCAPRIGARSAHSRCDLLEDAMLGSATLDLAVGMMFIFLMLSLVVSAVREAIEARLKARARHLARGLLELLGDPRLVEALYRHPLISALYDGQYDPSALNYQGHRHFSWIPAIVRSYFVAATNMPSYIPARTFALALVDLARSGRLDVAPPGEAGGAAAEPGAAGAAPLSIDGLRAALARSRGALPAGLLAALAPAGDEIDAGLQAIQTWYDGAMDRVSGWFKRDTQHILFWLGVVVAVALHVDSIFLVKFLAANPEARAHLAATAEQASADSGATRAVDALRAPRRAPPASGAPSPADIEAALRAADVKVSNAIHEITDLNLPVGWNHMRWNDFRVFDLHSLLTVLGWLITAFGVSFGAPFWFDLLNKMMVIRSTVKPHEKSPGESSEDRQKQPA